MGGTEVQAVPFLDDSNSRLDRVDVDPLRGGDLADVELVANVRMTFQYRIICRISPPSGISPPPCISPFPTVCKMVATFYKPMGL